MDGVVGGVARSGQVAAVNAGATELLWVVSGVALCVGGYLLWVLPVDRRASLRGIAAGVGIGLWLMALWWAHASAW